MQVLVLAVAVWILVMTTVIDLVFPNFWTLRMYFVTHAFMVVFIGCFPKACSMLLSDCMEQLNLHGAAEFSAID